LKGVKCHGEAASACPETVEIKQKQIQDLIEQSGFAAQDVFNMDKTGLFYVGVHFILQIFNCYIPKYILLPVCFLTGGSQM
jgi:hypothetical protein